MKETRIVETTARAMSPALERKVATTVFETGSFEKAAKVCEAWGCAMNDADVRQHKSLLAVSLRNHF